jgi:Ca2+-binding EF-hand superfamily protein
VNINAELAKPKDASDLADFEAAKAEVGRLRAMMADAAASVPVAAAAQVAPAVGPVFVKVDVWAKAVFEQFDTNADGKIDTKELNRAIKSLPVIAPKNKEEADAMSSSVNDMVSAMDANGDGGITLSEWLVNINGCPMLHSRIEAAVGDGGTVTSFRDFGEQKAKREKEVAALEAKENRTEEEEKDLADYKSQVERLGKLVNERTANQLQVKEWGETVFKQFDADGSGKLDSKELANALKGLPRTKPKYAPAGTKFMSVGDMVTTVCRALLPRCALLLG